MSFQVTAGLALVFEPVAQDMRTSTTIYISRQTLRTYSIASFLVDTNSNVDTFAKRSKCSAEYRYALLIYADVTPFPCIRAWLAPSLARNCTNVAVISAKRTVDSHVETARSCYLH